MRKSVLILATLIVAGIAQAASVDWSVDKNLWTDAAGNYVYAFNGSDKSAIQSILDTKEAADLASEFAKYANSNRNFTGKGGASGTIDLGDSVASGDNVDVFFVAFNTENIADATQYFVSQSVTGKAYAPPNTGDTPANWNDNTGVSGTWKDTFTSGGGGEGGDEIVPEPTTVALLALGLVAFGLKRKIA